MTGSRHEEPVEMPAADAALVSSHAVTISPLTECGQFYLEIVSSDTHGNSGSAEIAIGRTFSELPLTACHAT